MSAAEPLLARAATAHDESLLREWRNDPGTRHLSRTRDPVSAEDHRRWLDGSLGRGDRLLLVVERLDRTPVGVARWDRIDATTWEVSITVAPRARGRGTARPLLATAEAALVERVASVRRLVAVIHRDNVASTRVFVGHGYTPDAAPDASGFASFTRTAPAG